MLSKIAVLSRVSVESQQSFAKHLFGFHEACHWKSCIVVRWEAADFFTISQRCPLSMGGWIRAPPLIGQQKVLWSKLLHLASSRRAFVIIAFAGLLQCDTNYGSTHTHNGHVPRQFSSKPPSFLKLDVFSSTMTSLFKLMNGCCWD